MHVGLIVGIGPAATDFYYRYLIAALARAGQGLSLTMAHADTPTLLQNQAAGRVDAQVDIFLRLTERLGRCGVDRIAVTSIAGHFCIDALKAASPVPVIDLLEGVRNEVRRRRYKRVGLLGTRVVMETGLYGVLDGVEVVAPAALLPVHEAYVAMAGAGFATAAQRAVFLQAGAALAHGQGCEAILLAGTDLALVFKAGDDPGFETLDCAALHAAAIASAAMTAST
jgi:aspartate racemase